MPPNFAPFYHCCGQVISFLLYEVKCFLSSFFNSSRKERESPILLTRLVNLIASDVRERESKLAPFVPSSLLPRKHLMTTSVSAVLSHPYPDISFWEKRQAMYKGAGCYYSIVSLVYFHELLSLNFHEERGGKAHTHFSLLSFEPITCTERITCSKNDMYSRYSQDFSFSAHDKFSCCRPNWRFPSFYAPQWLWHRR